ncbi:MAG: glutaredoxin family protein [Vibrio sp.]
MQYSLYHKQTCPYCLKVRAVIDELGIQDQIPLVDVYANPADYDFLVEQAGRRMIPCLRIQQDGQSDQWMYESSDIIDYLRQQFA